MGEINLRNYLKRVETMLSDNLYTEALGHTRHILTTYPKNAVAYRVLGRVLVDQSQWVEASEVFRRLLGALPTDFVTHQQLSLVYEKLGQADSALYHLERAFDQQPNDKSVIERLRKMYEKTRGAPIEKVQLTAGAVANQYLNNNLPEQAIELLQKALNKMPDRVDLLLQLARAKWSAGKQEEAAENALRVLQQLPYAVMANRIMAEFWLGMERSADAQQFLLRIEEVDPYLALRLATGNAEDSAYTLEELDYRQMAQRELSNTNPDWLSSVGTVAESENIDSDEDLSWLDELVEDEGDVAPVSLAKKVTDNLPNLLDDFPELSGSGSENDVPAKDESFDGGLPASVMKRIESMRGSSNSETTITSGKPADRVSTGFTGILGEEGDDSFLGDVSPISVSGDSSGFTGLLAQMDDDNAIEDEGVAEDDLSWMNDLTSFDDESDDTLILPPKSVDFLSDIESGGVVMSPLAERASTGFTGFLDGDTGEFKAIDGIDDETSSAVTSDDDWMSGLVDDNLEPLPTAQELEVNDDWMSELPSQEPASDSQDPMAWMQNTDIEYDENTRSELEMAYDSLGEEEYILPTRDENPFAWMQGMDVEMTELPPEEESYFSLEDRPQTDPLAWMIEEGIEVEDEYPLASNDAGAHDAPLMDKPHTEWQNSMTEDPDNWQPEDELEGFEWLSDDEIDESLLSELENEETPSELDWMKDDTGEFAWEQGAVAEETLEDEGDLAETSYDEFGDFALEEGEEAIAEGGADWLSQLSDEGDEFGDFALEGEGDLAEASYDEFGDFALEEGEEAIAEGGADWLSQLSDEGEDDEFGDFALEGEGDLAEASYDEFGDFALDETVEGESFEWNPEHDHDAVTDDFGFSFESQPEANIEPDWLSRVALTADTLSSLEDEDAEDEPARLTVATEQDMEIDFAPTNESSEYSDFGYDDDEMESFSQAEFAYDETELGADGDLDPEEAIVAEVPDWLSEFGSNDDATLLQEAPQSLTNVLSTTQLGESADDELELDSANNAPDWLNAMVPGLDVDYSARGDSPLDEGFAEDVRSHRARTLPQFTAVNEGFEWLVDIVDEETNSTEVVPPPPMPEPLAAPLPMMAMPTTQSVTRFVFSRLPRWLQPKSTASQAKEDEEVDEAFDDDFDEEFDFDDKK